MNTPSLEPPDSAYRNFLHAVLFVLKGTVTLLQAATELYVALRGHRIVQLGEPMLKYDAKEPRLSEERPQSTGKSPRETSSKELEVTELDRAAAAAAARKLGLVFNRRKR